MSLQSKHDWSKSLCVLGLEEFGHVIDGGRNMSVWQLLSPHPPAPAGKDALFSHTCIPENHLNVFDIQFYFNIE